MMLPMKLQVLFVVVIAAVVGACAPVPVKLAVPQPSFGAWITTSVDAEPLPSLYMVP